MQKKIYRREYTQEKIHKRIYTRENTEEIGKAPMNPQAMLYRQATFTDRDASNPYFNRLLQRC